MLEFPYDSVIPVNISSLKHLPGKGHVSASFTKSTLKYWHWQHASMKSECAIGNQDFFTYSKPHISSLKLKLEGEIVLDGQTYMNKYFLVSTLHLCKHHLEHQEALSFLFISFLVRLGFVQWIFQSA